ncbi:ricin-type beta-trefoil lectin domain protein [Teladorsagia circumcincta]|uniref:Ricin-type beta-trefoil lectin domain protein n=1 Tax=Teladorsagia circumcincta TaxID=45464 RepID=A0A2G9TPB1_TELCI|nr:ricin-type beta-trefoil lectin domain protein [Teladorsagia circumcincta]
MDEYAEYYFIREPQAQRVDPGDISAQLALKERLHCKPFKWYMEKVAYDVLPSYPIPPKNKVWGEARNPQTGKCLDRMGGIPGPLGVNGCHGYGGNQLLRLNTEGQLAQGEWCLTPKGVRVEANHCVKGTVNGPWAYEEVSNMYISPVCVISEFFLQFLPSILSDPPRSHGGIDDGWLARAKGASI